MADQDRKNFEAWWLETGDADDLLLNDDGSYSCVPIDLAFAAWKAAAPAPQVPDGWRLVPVKPTPWMIDAGWIDKEDVSPEEIYAAMIAVAPPNHVAYHEPAAVSEEPHEDLCDDEGCPHHGTPHVCRPAPPFVEHPFAERMGESIAGMVIEWVDNAEQCDWRVSLAEVIARRVSRLLAETDAPPPEPTKAEVVVKPLDWEDATSPLISGIYFSRGASAFGTYRAERVSALWEVRTPEGDFLLDKVRRLPSLDAAKSAAQADYERRILSALATPPTAPVAIRSAARKPTHRHVKRGSTYRVIGKAMAQVSTGRQCREVGPTGSKSWHIRDIKDGDSLTVYEGADGKLWCRFSDEFNDGRFVALPGEEA